MSGLDYTDRQLSIRSDLNVMTIEIARRFNFELNAHPKLPWEDDVFLVLFLLTSLIDVTRDKGKICEACNLVYHTYTSQRNSAMRVSQCQTCQIFYFEAS